jgi:hypothetical protein
MRPAPPTKFSSQVVRNDGQHCALSRTSTAGELPGSDSFVTTLGRPQNQPRPAGRRTTTYLRPTRQRRIAAPSCPGQAALPTPSVRPQGVIDATRLAAVSAALDATSFATGATASVKVRCGVRYRSNQALIHHCTRGAGGLRRWRTPRRGAVRSGDLDHRVDSGESGLVVGEFALGCVPERRDADVAERADRQRPSLPASSYRPCRCGSG